MPENTLLCRESSLLAFNRRVLAQAQDTRTPLLERLRFLCIVSSNLDEFFEVRMSWLKRFAKDQPHKLLDNGEVAAETFSRVLDEARDLIAEQYRVFNHELIPALAQENIFFYPRKTWNDAQKAWIEAYFHREVLPILTPIGLDPAHPFPRLLNKSLNFAVQVEGVDAFGRFGGMAIVQAPRILPRVVKLPQHLCDGADGFVFLSSVLHAHVHTLFTGMSVKGCYQFRLTRDSDLSVDDEEVKNLRTAIQGELHDRQFGEGVRLEVAENCPEEVFDFLLGQFSLNRNALYRVAGPVNLVRLMAILDMIERPDLKFPAHTPAIPQQLQKNNRLLDAIRAHDILLHHPYQSFEPTVRLIEQATQDSSVVAIKMTIYRTGSNSDLAAALMNAALAGKEVTVVVELMARFDEENNVNWASKLESVGAHVVYGVFGYKIHAKMLLIVRREEGCLKRYAHVSTGNYHQGTSRIYTDFGLMTANDEITADVNAMFMEITGLGQPSYLHRLAQSPFTLHTMLLQSIENEEKIARAGGQGRIIAKMNSLIEPSIIKALYKASKAGVSIDLIVRGICTLKPGIAGLSDNIRVRSIIGRLLEHSRIFYFENNGQSQLWLSSADWMARNLFRRVETCVPIESDTLKTRIKREALTLALNDNQCAWQMKSDGTYERVTVQEGEEVIHMQQILLQEYSEYNEY